MFNLIERYMNQVTKEKVNTFALNNGITLSDEELSFTHEFIQKNWKQILTNHGEVNLDKYKEKFSNENFPKVKRLYSEYINRYKNYL